MDAQLIFGIQFVLSVTVFGLILKWKAVPWLNRQDKNEALFWLAAPHAFRHIGLVFLVPGVVDQTLPGHFAIPAAYGDFLSGILALLSLVALRNRWSAAVSLVWLFNIVGSVDLVNALRHAEVVPSFGAAWYIPTMIVPLLLVTHYQSFVRLLKPQVVGESNIIKSEAA